MTDSFDPSGFRPWLGEYAGSGRRIVLAMYADADLGDPFAFYTEGDALLRLDPTWSSTRGEQIELAPEDAGRCLIVRTADGARQSLTRSEDVIEEDVTFAVPNGPMLAGTFLRPSGPGPHPAVLLVHAAAGGQRDFYRLFAHPFVRKGVAALIFDRPAGNTIFDNADAAEAGLDYLQSRPDVRAESVGMWGISNGMWSVPLVAARRPDLAFVAGAGAPGVSVAAAEVFRRGEVLRAAHVPGDVVRMVEEAWTIIFDAVADGAARPEAMTRLDDLLTVLANDRSLARYPVPDYARIEPMLSPLPPPPPASELFARIGGAADPELGFDAIPSWRTITCPVLLQYGDSDANVPAAASAERIAAALRPPGNRDATITTYPDTSHMLELVPEPLDGKTLEETMYTMSRFRFAPGVVEELSGFAADRTGTTEPTLAEAHSDRTARAPASAGD